MGSRPWGAVAFPRREWREVLDASLKGLALLTVEGRPRKQPTHSFAHSHDCCQVGI